MFITLLYTDMNTEQIINMSRSLLRESNYKRYHFIVARIVGIKAAILFEQLVDAEEVFQAKGQLVNCNGVEDCFFNTVEKIEEFTLLTAKEQRTAKNKLVEIGILSIQQAGMPRKNYFKIEHTALMHLLGGQKVTPVVTNGQHCSDERALHYKDNDKDKNKNNIIESSTGIVNNKVEATTRPPLVVNVKVRQHLVVIADYEEKGEYDLDEIVPKIIRNEYTEESLHVIARRFFNYYVQNKDKLTGKVNLKARFAQFVSRDYHGEAKKKSIWPGIHLVTDEEFIQLLADGHFKNSRCPFYLTHVKPTLDTQGVNTFNEMMGFFRNRDVVGYKGMRFNEWMIKNNRMIG